MSRSRRHPALLRLLAVSLCAAACGGAFSSVALAAGNGSSRLLTLETQFMCVSCHEPLELVSSPQAQSEKAYIGSLLAQGKSDAQIKANMVAQYGPEVLARPPASGFNLTVYILPPALVLVGLAMLAFTLPKWRQRSRIAANTPLQGAAPLRPDQTERLDHELTRLR